jgi:hypothetical protein
MMLVFKLVLMISFAAISLAALFVFIVAAMTVGLGGVLPFSRLPEGVRIKALPYRRRLLYLIYAAAVVCMLLAVVQLFFV